MEADPMTVERARELILPAIWFAEGDSVGEEGDREALDWLCARVAELERENAALASALADIARVTYTVGDDEGVFLMMNGVANKIDPKTYAHLYAALAAQTKAGAT
jgi:hypothetical protein